MIRIQLFLGVIVFALWLYCVVDVISTRESDMRNLPKVGWLLLVLIFPLVGSIAWLAAGRPPPGQPPRDPRRSRPVSPYPEYDRPGRRLASDPEADEDFLRRCRERAEEQRRAYRDSQRPDDPDAD